MSKRALPLLFALLTVGCGDDPAATTSDDTGTGGDTAVGDTAVGDTGGGDTSTGDTGAGDTGAGDTGAGDTGVADAAKDATADAATDATADATTDGTPTDGGGCHTLVWGTAEVTFSTVKSIPSPTGGTIATGVYDATEVWTTGTLTGRYRATWQFDGDGTMKIYEALATGDSALPTPSPKTLTWSTATTTLSRTQTCGGTTAFSNGYSVRTSSAGTFLDVQSGTLQFTFKKR